MISNIAATLKQIFYHIKKKLITNCIKSANDVTDENKKKLQEPYFECNNISIRKSTV